MKIFMKQMLKNITRLEKGFTLVEMLLYMGLLSIFLVVLTDLFVNILDVKSESEATSAVEQDGRYVLARLAYDVSRAADISQPLNLGQSNNNLVMTIDGVTYTYSLNGTNLQLDNNLGTNNLNSSESRVSGLNFTKIGNAGGKETIQVTFTLTSAATRVGSNEVRAFNTTVGRR